MATTKPTKEERRAARKVKKQEAADRQLSGEAGALNRQVGGSHYISKIQHVEFCQMNRIPWCEAAAIKYILRHRSKNGAQDIEKAVHYLELLQCLDYGRREEVPTDMDPEEFLIPLADFLKENVVPPMEAECITNICWHQLKGGDGGTDGLMETQRKLKRILENYSAQDDMSLL
jgi:hypothetical protein